MSRLCGIPTISRGCRDRLPPAPRIALSFRRAPARQGSCMNAPSACPKGGIPMRKEVLSWLAGVLLLGAATARAQDVTMDYDHAYDFTAVKTFAVKIGTSWGNELSET